MRLALGLLAVSILGAVTVDRIAIVVGNAIIKDSDIDRNVRVTAFLNREPVILNQKTRRDTAQRMVDQTFIRNEVLTGDYPGATRQQAEQQIEALRKQRGAAEFNAELKRDGLVEEDLVEVTQFQLTVLNFIDARFKPAAFVSDDEVTKYYQQHQAELKRRYPKRDSLDQLRGEITSMLQGQKVNKLFFDWLDDQRKNGHIEYREPDLKPVNGVAK